MTIDSDDDVPLDKGFSMCNVIILFRFAINDENKEFSEILFRRTFV